MLKILKRLALNFFTKKTLLHHFLLHVYNDNILYYIPCVIIDTPVYIMT